MCEERMGKDVIEDSRRGSSLVQDQHTLRTDSSAGHVDNTIHEKICMRPERVREKRKYIYLTIRAPTLHEVIHLGSKYLETDNASSQHCSTHIVTVFP